MSAESINMRPNSDQNDTAPFQQSEAVDTKLLFSIVVSIGQRLNFGEGPCGRRVLYGVSGGQFDGPELHGEVLPYGGDWALYRTDGGMSIDAKLTLRTHDDALILMTYCGRLIVPETLKAAMADDNKRHEIDRSSYYFRTTPLFDTGSAKYGWLNNIVGVGRGRVVEGGVGYEIWQVL